MLVRGAQARAQNGRASLCPGSTGLPKACFRQWLGRRSPRQAAVRRCVSLMCADEALLRKGVVMRRKALQLNDKGPESEYADAYWACLSAVEGTKRQQRADQ